LFRAVLALFERPERRKKRRSGDRRPSVGNFSSRGLNAVMRTAMQGQSIRLSHGNCRALPNKLITCRPPMAVPRGRNIRPLMGRRSESWSIGHWRARAPGPVRRS